MPDSQVQKKVDKYFQPYNYDQNRSKHMTFYDQEELWNELSTFIFEGRQSEK